MSLEQKYFEILNFWKNKNITSAAELEVAINGKIVPLAYHSGKIENNLITYRDTREIFEHDGVIKYTGDLRTLFEIKNAKDAFHFFLTAFDKKMILNKEFICKLQKQLTKNTYDNNRRKIGEKPGEYKKHDYVTGMREVGASPEEVEEEMNELLDEINNFKGSEVILAGAYFHVKSENIHQFADGNGRTGRLALNYFLVNNNHPPIIIYEEDRNEYYECLESWDIFQSLSEMKKFLMEQTVKTWSKK